MGVLLHYGNNRNLFILIVFVLSRAALTGRAVSCSQPKFCYQLLEEARPANGSAHVPGCSQYSPHLHDGNGMRLASQCEYKHFILCGRFNLEEPPGPQRVYSRPGTPPPTKVTVLSDKEQKDWVKDSQGITEQ